MPRRVKQINDLVIDEISLVDKGANQHATVTIAKSASGEKEKQMEIFDEQGNPLDPEALEDGDVVYGEDGSAYLFELDGDQGEYDDEDAYSPELEMAEIGKARWDSMAGRAKGLYDRGYIAAHSSRAAGAARRGSQRAGAFRNKVGREGGRAFKRSNGFRETSGVRFASNQGTPRALNEGGHSYGPHSARDSAAAFGMSRGQAAASDFGNKVWGNGSGARNRKIAAGATGVTLAGAGGAYGYHEHVKKNFADEVREELSKALSDSERDDVISKALSYVEDYAEEAAIAQEIAKSERDLRLHREYTEIAKSYELPIDDEVLGGVLMRCAEQLSYEDCSVIAKALEVAGEAGLYDEYGAIGGGDNSDVLAQVNAFADTQVSKSGMSREEFSAELFGAHPELYDEFLAERRGF